MDKIKRRGKRYLTYAITEDLEDEIRTYVNAINKRTGITKQRIVSDLIVAGMRGKKFYIDNQENQAEAIADIAIAKAAAKGAE